MKALIGLLLVALAVAIAALLAEAGAFGGAWALQRRGLYDDEIRWLQGFQPFMRWERGVARLIARRQQERIERALRADRVDRAVHLFRAASAEARAARRPLEPALMMLGIETYRRASDRMARHGRLSEAADWDDSLLVLAVRAPAPEHRYAAMAGFMEGLDLRVRDGKPCAALSRLQWAKRGLGGTLPGMAPSVEEDLTLQCAQQRRREGRR
jgi:hypothetical protein